MSGPKPREHGTYTGYQQHIRRHEVPCDSCRGASAARMQRYRDANPDTYARELASSAARTRALERLGREYPARFRELLTEERSPIYAPGGAP